jgi:hypothetical protein
MFSCIIHGHVASVKEKAEFLNRGIRWPDSENKLQQYKKLK